LIVYYFLSTFIGIYLESYRLNSFKNGYLYDYERNQKRDKERKEREDLMKQKMKGIAQE